jgi:hypothetical protein
VPDKTIAIAAIKYCPDVDARKKSPKDAIATAPEAPPSWLSKKLIEFVTPTIQKIVIRKSSDFIPVGEPTVLVIIRKLAMTIPVNV